MIGGHCRRRRRLRGRGVFVEGGGWSEERRKELGPQKAWLGCSGRRLSQLSTPSHFNSARNINPPIKLYHFLGGPLIPFLS